LRGDAEFEKEFKHEESCKKKEGLQQVGNAPHQTITKLRRSRIPA